MHHCFIEVWTFYILIGIGYLMKRGLEKVTSQLAFARWPFASRLVLYMYINFHQDRLEGVLRDNSRTFQNKFFFYICCLQVGLVERVSFRILQLCFFLRCFPCPFNPYVIVVLCRVPWLKIEGILTKFADPDCVQSHSFTIYVTIEWEKNAGIAWPWGICRAKLPLYHSKYHSATMILAVRLAPAILAPSQAGTWVSDGIFGRCSRFVASHSDFGIKNLWIRYRLRTLFRSGPLRAKRVRKMAIDAMMIAMQASRYTKKMIQVRSNEWTPRW